MGNIVHDDYLGNVELLSDGEKRRMKAQEKFKETHYERFFKQDCHDFLFWIIPIELHARFGDSRSEIANNFAKYVFCDNKSVRKGMDYSSELVVELATRGRFKGNDLEKIQKFIKKFSRGCSLFATTRVRHSIKLLYLEYKKSQG